MEAWKYAAVIYMRQDLQKRQHNNHNIHVLILICFNNIFCNYNLNKKIGHHRHKIYCHTCTSLLTHQKSKKGPLLLNYFKNLIETHFL